MSAASRKHDKRSQTRGRQGWERRTLARGNRALLVAAHQLLDGLWLRVGHAKLVHRNLETVVQVGRPHESLLLIATLSLCVRFVVVVVL